MPRPKPLQDVHAELADEHRRIMALVGRLQALDDVDELTPMLEELHDRLVDHFAHEQFPGGLYEAMGAHGPEHTEVLKTLIREHCVILSTARALLERSRRPDPNAGAALLTDVSSLLSMLQEHEHREHELAEKLKADASSAA